MSSLDSQYKSRPRFIDFKVMDLYLLAMLSF
jgi:hypothetical protein